MLKIHEDEITITNRLIELVEWSERLVDERTTPVLYCEFFPIRVNKAFAINLTHVNKKIKDTDYVFFRPIRNGKHCQFLLDTAFEIDDNIKDFIVVKNHKQHRFSGTLLTHNGKDVKIDNMYSEAELKVALLIKYWEDEDVTKQLKAIHEFNEKHKHEQQEKGVKKTSSKPSLKMPRMK